jgi:LacI family transcriptional regulator
MEIRDSRVEPRRGFNPCGDRFAISSAAIEGLDCGRPAAHNDRMSMSSRKLRSPPPQCADGGPLVAVVVDTALPYDREIAKGVAQYARGVGDWRLYVEEEVGRRVPNFAAWPGHGIIASFDDRRIAQRIRASRLPVVAVGGGFADAEGIPCVATDNARIAALAADHLLERAIRHFGFYGLPPSPQTCWSHVRSEAFARRLAAAGQSCQTLIARHDSTRWSLLQAELTEWIGSLPTPVGIMACDDLRARHVLEACRTLGLRVPHDVAVIGVDDDDFVCELSDPPLSSIAQAARKVGHEAARLLDRLMRVVPGTAAGAQKDVPMLTVVPPIGAVPRRSTDTLAVKDPEVAAVIRIIRERVSEGIGVADLVKASRLSRWQLEDRFRRTVGRSIHEDILQVRLAEARRLVTTTDLALKSIAPRVGCRSIAYMTTLFRRHFKTTPAALRMVSRGIHKGGTLS